MPTDEQIERDAYEEALQHIARHIASFYAVEHGARIGTIDAIADTLEAYGFLDIFCPRCWQFQSDCACDRIQKES